MFSMMRFTVAVLFLLLYIPAINALPRARARSSLVTSPLLPSQDPFYVAPEGFEQTSPGTILRSRALPGIAAPIALEAVYQLLYRTTNALGSASVSVTTVIIPPNATYSQHLSYQTAYDEADWDCSPSYALQIGAVSNATVGDVSEIEHFAGLALARGIPVSTPDYEGEEAAFGVGPVAAYGTLDSIRAVLSSQNITGIAADAESIMFGYSGGSIATEWACEYSATYAPELNIIGAAFGGTPVNATTVFLGLNGSANAGLVVASAQGFANAYPDFNRCLNKNLVEAKAEEFHAVLNLCQTDALGTAAGGYLGVYAYSDVISYLKKGVNFLHAPCWRKALHAAGIMGQHGVPKKFPLYIFKGTADEDTPSIEDTDDLVEKFCKHGARVTYVRYVNGSHINTLLRGYPAAFDFLFGLLYGESAPAGCSTTDLPGIPLS